MRFGKTLMAATAASLMMMGTALADWNGLYVGTFFGLTKSPMGGPVVAVTPGAQAGFNFVPGNYFLGLGFEAAPALLVPGVTPISTDFAVVARLGALVGADVAVYGLVGYGSQYTYMFPLSALIIGVGAEVAIGDRIGLFGEIRRINAPGAPPPGAYGQFRLGLNVHQ
jgi:hypothetical protein